MQGFVFNGESNNLPHPLQLVKTREVEQDSEGRKKINALIKSRKDSQAAGYLFFALAFGGDEAINLGFGGGFVEKCLKIFQAQRLIKISIGDGVNRFEGRKGSCHHLDLWLLKPLTHHLTPILLDENFRLSESLENMSN